LEHDVEADYDYLICGDMKKEIFDFLAVSEKGKRVVAIHAKSQEFVLSASFFQTIVAQAIKSLDYLNPLSRLKPPDLIERYCKHARQMAQILQKHAQVRVRNEVVLNQVLVQFVPLPGDPRDEAVFTQQVVEGIQRDGTCWLGSTE
jgi:hypothetical protein